MLWYYYSAGDSYGIDQTVDGSNIRLYAIWQLSTYNLVITGDSNVASLSVKADSITGPTTICTKSGVTFTCSNLTNMTSYYLFPVFNDNYEFNSWTKNDSTSGSALSSTTDENAYYTMGAGAGLLTLTSKIICVGYMQDLNPSNIATRLPNVGDTTKVFDKRDNTCYTIGKLADGNYWLLDNLAIDLENVSLSSLQNNTNATGSTLNYLKNGGGTTSDRYAITGVGNLTSGNSFSEGRANVSYKNAVPTDAISQSGGYKVGGYYNYCAASAGSYCYGDGDNDSGTPSGNATEDICPAGWRMPTGDMAIGDYELLANAIYGSTDQTSDATAYANYRAALHLPLSGYFTDGSASANANGYFLSSTRTNDSNIRTLYVQSNPIKISPFNNMLRNRGYSIRCIMDQTYMQDLNPTSINELLPNTGDKRLVRDKRDEKLYAIGKLADDNYWMLDNLAIDLENVSLSDLQTKGTNATGSTLNILKNGGGTTSDRYATTGVSTSWSTDSYSVPMINTASENVIPTDATSTANDYKVGNYYNYCAASAGSYCYGDDTNAGTSVGNATEDICPAGWRIPTGGSSGEYKALYDNSTYNNYVNYRTALQLPLSGYYSNGSRNNLSTEGYWWSSTRRTDNQMMQLHLTSNSINPSDYGDRIYGRSIRCIMDDTYMQDLTPTTINDLLPNAGDKRIVRDKRDEKLYAIGKLADDNYWMLDNLAIDLENVSLSDLQTKGTNASNTTLNYLKNGGGTSSDQYAITGIGNLTSGNSYSEPRANLNSKDTISSDTTDQANSYKIGGYYNYCAASAGSYCYGDGTSEGTSVGNAAEDICPASWRMPTGSTSGEFSALANSIYGSTDITTDATAYANYRVALQLPLSGFFEAGSAYNQAQGYWWSSTRNSNHYMYRLNVYGSGIRPTADSHRTNGYSVRCLKDLTYDLVVTGDANLSSMTVKEGSTSGTTINGTKFGNTVTFTGLKKATNYYLYPVFASGYEFDSWTKTDSTTGSAISSTSTENAYYTMGAGAGALTLTSKISCVSFPTYMQEFDETANYCDTSGILKDNRDEKSYNVAKLADNKWWMLDNLALDLTNSTILNRLSAENTNIAPANAANILTSLKYGNRSAGNQYANGAIGNLSAGNDYSKARVNMDYENTVPTDAMSTAGGWKTGGYYNYCAASAGSYCYGNGADDAGTTSNDATSDICPKKWRLPTGDYTGEYSALAWIIYGSTRPIIDNTAATNYRAALHLPLAGIYFFNAPYSQNSDGQFWTSTRYDNSYMRNLIISSGQIMPDNARQRYFGNSIRCVFDPSQETPSYNVTVNMDSHISSVSFYNSDYGTQTATTNNNTVSLRRNSIYTITASTSDQYTFKNWSTTVYGTLGSTDYNPTTYKVNNTSTLTVTSAYYKTIANSTTMQEVEACPKGLTTGQVYTLKDSRDNQQYKVAKLIDNNCWMLDNLALDLANTTVLNGLSTSNTNIDTTNDPNALAALKGTSVRNPSTDPNGKYATARVANTPSSYSYSAPLIILTDKNIVPQGSDPMASAVQAGGWKVGGYYNYCAASAGSYCYGNGTSAGTSSGNATSDICPKGWRMPTGYSSGEYQSLYNLYYNDYTNFRSALHMPLSGFVNFGQSYEHGNYGNWWTSTRGGNDSMSELDITTETIVNRNVSYTRYYGYTMRCIVNNTQSPTSVESAPTPEPTESTPTQNPTQDQTETPTTNTPPTQTSIAIDDDDEEDEKDASETTTSPQGVITEEDAIEYDGSDLYASNQNNDNRVALAVAAGIATTIASAAFILTKRKKDEEEDNPQTPNIPNDPNTPNTPNVQ